MRAPASCIYEGRVRHRRFLPVHHAFDFRLFMLYLDLDELPTLFDRHLLWSARRPALAWFRREDHLGEARLPLATSVRELVTRELGRAPAGPIRLLTHLRYFGHCFNPLSLYYCFNEDGERLDAVVAEVSNTPWGERHCYVLDRPCTADGRPAAIEHAKAFHVSPFMPMEQSYRWRLAPPLQELVVHIASWENERCAFEATLELARREISAGELARQLLRHPLMTLRVQAAIYLQAARLALRGLPVHPHPRRRQGRSSDRPRSENERES